jgi:hypothetical protein
LKIDKKSLSIKAKSRMVESHSKSIQFRYQETNGCKPKLSDKLNVLVPVVDIIKVKIIPLIDKSKAKIEGSIDTQKLI